MLKRLFFLVSILLAFYQTEAKGYLLGGLNLDEGRWEVVGVSLHNYKMLPIQEELGTFIVKEKFILKEWQNKWVKEEKFEDYCDYHYALKFYKNGELMQTLRVNLLCNYISLGGMSYEFDMDDFVEYKRFYDPIKWSRIRFRDLDLLKASVQKLDDMPGVYWYGDVQQYNFSGSFSISVDSLPWNADRELVAQELTDKIVAETGREDFYLSVKYWLISDDLDWMTIKFNVFCVEDFYDSYPKENIVTRWRNHFSEQSFVQVVVIGMNKKDYYAAMRGGS